MTNIEHQLPPNKPRVLLVTGVSGAGKNSALKLLEDLGYEAVDNVPLSLLPRLVLPSDNPSPIAIGIDIRSRHFSVEAFLKKVTELKNRNDIEASLVFMDCDDEILERRFEETRRRHPLAIDRPIADGIRQERELMAAVKNQATLLIDTTELVLGDTKRILEGHFADKSTTGLTLIVTSFGFSQGLPRDADLVFDVRFLRNPHYDVALRSLTGMDEAVGAYICQDNAYLPFFEKTADLIDFLLVQYAKEGKSYLTIAFGCTGGRHRSVYLAKKMTEWLENREYTVKLRHRDKDKPRH